MQDTLIETMTIVGKKQSMIERAMDSGELSFEPTDDNDKALNLDNSIGSSQDEQIEATEEMLNAIQEKERERITLAIQAVEIRLLQDRIAELTAHLARSEIRCNKLVKEKKQLIEILLEAKPKSDSPPKKYWPNFWK